MIITKKLPLQGHLRSKHPFPGENFPGFPPLPSSLTCDLSLAIITPSRGSEGSPTADQEFQKARGKVYPNLSWPMRRKGPQIGSALCRVTTFGGREKINSVKGAAGLFRYSSIDWRGRGNRGRMGMDRVLIRKKSVNGE